MSHGKDDRQLGSSARSMRWRVTAIYAALLSANLAAWAWAFWAFAGSKFLLGTALLAYGLGLRHAVDADHIAAIDNVTRKLMHNGQRPLGVGLFFSLGHSTVVVIGMLLIVGAAAAMKGRLQAFRDVAGVIGTLVSAGFLLLIAAINLLIFFQVYQALSRVKRGQDCPEADINALLAGRGLLARIFRPLMAMMRRSWHMYPLGFLFGLGFDTATEIGLLGIAAAQASRGLPTASILVFPALFTAGMSLVDTTDGLLMLGAYGWAYITPMRKLHYNLMITLLSVIVALVIGGAEALGLVVRHFNLGGWFWAAIAALNTRLGALGYAVIAIFVLAWLGASLLYRAKRYDRLSVETERPPAKTSL